MDPSELLKTIEFLAEKVGRLEDTIQDLTSAIDVLCTQQEQSLERTERALAAAARTESALGTIQASTAKMDAHIEFVDGVYARVEGPMHYVCDKYQAASAPVKSLCARGRSLLGASASDAAQ